jgi:hypothetical protein
VSQVLEFSAEEVMVLTDRVTNADYGTEDQRVTPYLLLLKLGSAYVEMLGNGVKREGMLQIALTESELWLLRSKVNSTDKTPNDSLFGVKLLTKLYSALLAESAEVPIEFGDSVGQQFGELERAALAKWKERPDARDDADENDADHRADYGADAAA